MKLLLVAVLFAVVAQLPSCSAQEIVGFVDDKYILGFEGRPQPVIIIGAAEYNVPWEFYRQVEIGDLVKNENGRWIIVRKVKK